MKCGLVFRNELQKIRKKNKTLAYVIFLIPITNAVLCLMNIENKTEADVVSGMTAGCSLSVPSFHIFIQHLIFLIRDTLSSVQFKSYI